MKHRRARVAHWWLRWPWFPGYAAARFSSRSVTGPVAGSSHRTSRRLIASAPAPPTDDIVIDHRFNTYFPRIHISGGQHLTKRSRADRQGMTAGGTTSKRQRTAHDGVAE